MKRNLFLLTMIMFLSMAFMAQDVQAQRDVKIEKVGVKGGSLYSHYDTVFATGTAKYSVPFQFNTEMKLNWYTNPFTGWVDATVPTTGTPKGWVVLEAAWTKTGTYTAVDTLIKSADSTMTNLYATLDLNNQKLPWYRLKYFITSASADSVKFNSYFYNPYK